MWLEWLAIIISLFFAMNIGASGAAATMGIAYGSGAIVSRKKALILVSIGVFLGALIGGDEVVKTLGSGIIPANLLTAQIVMIILLSATIALFVANRMGIPLSTSEVTVGSVIGVGLAFQSLYIGKILVIVSFWILTPFLSFVMAWGSGQLIQWLYKKKSTNQIFHQSVWKSLLTYLVIGAGFFEAFSAGMNNVANAVGPIIGAGLIGENQGIIFGGMCVGLGAIWLGGKVLETNGKKIVSLTLLQGFAISLTSGVLVVISSLNGIPVPLTQMTTSAILGIGLADQGRRIWQKSIIYKILRVWVVSPMITMVFSFTLVKTFIEPSGDIIVVILALTIAVWGVQSLYRSSLEEKRIYNEDGSGI
jgi:sulfate permease